MTVIAASRSGVKLVYRIDEYIVCSDASEFEAVKEVFLNLRCSLIKNVPKIKRSLLLVPPWQEMGTFGAAEELQSSYSFIVYSNIFSSFFSPLFG